MAAAYDDEGVNEDETILFDLKKHLESYNFTDYDKIKNAIDSKEVTMTQILECNETELNDFLSDYGIRPIQKKRFVRAIKSLTNSKMNNNNNNNSNNNSNNNNNNNDMLYSVYCDNNDDNNCYVCETTAIASELHNKEINSNINDSKEDIILATKLQEHEVEKSASICRLGAVKVDFAQHSIPSDVKQKAPKMQAALIANVYKKLLFDQFGKRDCFGGYILLAAKNYKRGSNNKLLSPEQLGFQVTEMDLVAQIIKGNLKIKSCIGTTKSGFNVILELENTTGTRINTTLEKGHAFGQNKFRNVQNLVVKEDHAVSVAPYSTIKVSGKAYCDDRRHACPKGEAMEATPFKKAAVSNGQVTNQSDLWKLNDENDENNDLSHFFD